MAAFEIPTALTARLRLRAFRAGNLDAYAALQANPEVMRYLVTRRTASRPVSAQGGGGLSRGRARDPLEA